jgi:ankyrin repeat protein
VTEKAGRADPVEAMKLFVAAGAKVNAANDSGNTALHYAALNGSARGVEFLAANGASLDLKNKQGKTPLELASGKGAAAAALRRLTSPSAN